MRIKNALNQAKLNKFIENSDLRTLAKIKYEIYDLNYYWMGMPSKDRIENIQISYPYLKEIIDFQTVLKRLEYIDEFKNKEESNSSFSEIKGISISRFIPELDQLVRKIWSIFEKLPKGLEKAELFLYPFAKDVGANAELEAAIYFTGQGENLVDSQELRKEWHRIICIDIERGNSIGKIPASVLERAKSRVISLSEAAEVLKFNGFLPSFFSYRDEEEDFIDSTFFRAVEWFSIKGFEPWIDSIAHEMSTLVQNGIDPLRASWTMFYWCRSDLALKKTEKIGLESLLYSIINGTLDRINPWKTSWDKSKDYIITDYLPTASSIVFSWYRINPVNINPEVLNRAIELLFQTQLHDGSWPIVSYEHEGSLISTCFAIHALALAKPSGWQEVVTRSRAWLLENQNIDGFWQIEGGPTIMLTVLALESIHLASGNKNVSFKISQENNLRSIEDPIDEIIKYNYAAEEWYTRPIPPRVSITKQLAIDFFKPRIAIVTAVEVELLAVLKSLKPPKGKRKVWKVNDGGEIYYLGRFGEFDTVVMMSGMGTQGASGSTLTIDSLIRLWDPIGIIMVGIAFGVNRKKHRVGDVLIADSIIPYESQRVGEKVSFRNPIVPSSYELINRIKNTIDWKFKRPDNTIVNKHIGNLLSGEKLVDNLDFKNFLLEQYPQAIGGEMEGSGLWAVAQKHKKSWIIIKSVCDWGDGKKSDHYQSLAAASAVSLCEYILNDKNTLDGMK